MTPSDLTPLSGVQKSDYKQKVKDNMMVLHHEPKETNAVKRPDVEDED